MEGFWDVLNDKQKELFQSIELPAGAPIFSDGDPCENFIFVTKGAAKVVKLAENGREIVLYRVCSDEACVLTTVSLLNGESYSASAFTEELTTAYLLSKENFLRLMGESAEFRLFVFSSFSYRISDLILLVEEIAFKKVDIRLAQYLVDRSDNKGLIQKTHQEIASDLGSVREVITRQLRDFTKKQWVSVHRGLIEVHSISNLKSFIQDSMLSD